MLKQAEIWPPNVVKGDDFPVDYRVLGQIAEGLDDVWVLSAERFPFSRNKAHLAFQVGGDGAVSIEFDFFCGIRRYVAVEHGTSH